MFLDTSMQLPKCNQNSIVSDAAFGHQSLLKKLINDLLTLSVNIEIKLAAVDEKTASVSSTNSFLPFLILLFEIFDLLLIISVDMATTTKKINTRVDLILVLKFFSLIIYIFIYNLQEIRKDIIEIKVTLKEIAQIMHVSKKSNQNGSMEVSIL